MPSEAGYPARWRHEALAGELCQRAAEIAGGELPGSYRSAAGPGPPGDDLTDQVRLDHVLAVLIEIARRG